MDHRLPLPPLLFQQLPMLLPLLLQALLPTLEATPTVVATARMLKHP